MHLVLNKIWTHFLHLSPPVIIGDMVYHSPASGRLTRMCMASRDCKKPSRTTPTSFIGYFTSQTKKNPQTFKRLFKALLTCIITLIFCVVFVVFNSSYILSPHLPPFGQASSSRLSLPLFTIIFSTQSIIHSLPLSSLSRTQAQEATPSTVPLPQQLPAVSVQDQWEEGRLGAAASDQMLRTNVYPSISHCSSSRTFPSEQTSPLSLPHFWRLSCISAKKAWPLKISFSNVFSSCN